jgi:tRNA A-37 threonylcarbamoyl transferase component Bud32
MIFEIFYILKCIYYFFMYKTYSYFSIEKNNLLNDIYNFIIELGPFFVKILQNMDLKKLLPTDILELTERSKNCVYYNTNDYNTILKNIKETGFELESNVPIGAGSICLVYKGIYKGHNSIIKICHNNIRQKMEKSIKILDFLINICNFFGLYTILVNNIDVQDIIKNVNQQINLNQEVKNIKLYKKELEKYDLLNLFDVPDVYKYSSNYIIESYIDGLTYHQILKKHQEKTFECITLIRIITRYQIAYFNINHGDLHTSNYLFKIDNNNVKLYLIDFGLCNSLNQMSEEKKLKYKNTRHLLVKFYIPEIGIFHPFISNILYLKNQNLSLYLNKDKEQYPVMFNLLRKIMPNIHDDLLLKHILDNIDQITRKEILTFQFENYECMQNYISEIIKTSKYINTVELPEKFENVILSSQIGMLKSIEMILNLNEGKQYCDNFDDSKSPQELYKEYYIKYVIENLPQDKYLDDIDDKIKMSYQQIVYMFQIKYKKQLDRKDIKKVLLSYQHEIKDYLYHFFYRNEYYTQRNIIINKMYTFFFLEYDLLHGMIEYLQLKKPNDSRQKYYDIPVSDINIDNIKIMNNRIVYVRSEKGIFKGDKLIKIGDKNISNCSIQECLNMIKTDKIITFKDCFLLENK